MMLRQSIDRNHHRLSDLVPAVAGVFGDGAGVAVIHLAETGPCIGRGRTLAGHERQAPDAAAGIDRCNRAAIAVERVGGHHLAFERVQAERLDCELQFRAVIRRYAGQLPAQGATLNPPPSHAISLPVRLITRNPPP